MKTTNISLAVLALISTQSALAAHLKTHHQFISVPSGGGNEDSNKNQANQDSDDDDEDAFGVYGIDQESEDEAGEAILPSNSRFRSSSDEHSSEYEPYYHRPKPCHHPHDPPCNDDDCDCCPCKDEIYQVNEKAACTLQKVCDIDHDTGHIGKAVVAIGEMTSCNHSLLEQILTKVCADPGEGDQIIVNCGCDCDDDNGGGVIPEPETGNCESITNTLEINEQYTFSQYGLTTRGRMKEFQMASGAINAADSNYNGSFHGLMETFPGNFADFGQASFAIKPVQGDEIAEEQSIWTCIGDAAAAATLGGCQLEDAQGYCFGWSPALDDDDDLHNNFNDEEPAVAITTLQWVPCITAAEIEADDTGELTLLLQKQLWFAEPWAANNDKSLLRQVCSDDVVKKVPGERSHDPLWADQDKKGCRYPPHFELELVPVNQCENAIQFNDCSWLTEKLEDL